MNPSCKISSGDTVFSDFQTAAKEYVTPPRHLKDPETSSVISMGSNAKATSAYQEEQRITDYEPNVLEITTAHRPIVTRY